MASRSARPRSGSRRAAEKYHYEDEAGGVGAFLARHRLVVGGLTAFVVAFSYVGANAIWYQPHAHGSAFFATRPHLTAQVPVPQDRQEALETETVIRLEREQARLEDVAPQTRPFTPTPTVDSAPIPQRLADASAQAPVPRTGDPVVAEVQHILAGLNLYEGDVDGLNGPQTRSAIESYRRKVGLDGPPEIDDQLLSQLGAAPRTPRVDAPVPKSSPATDPIETASAPARGETMIMRIQAGLRAFGNDGIEIDGRVGSRTKSAILEFQSLFGLPETGEPDEALYAKMRDIGLTD